MSYIVGHPIKHPADFYGRHEQTTRFFEIIGGRQAQSVSVLGVRRAGKTSFLQYVAHPATMSHYLADADAYTMVYLDMTSCKTPSDFYYRLLQRLKMKLGSVKTDFLWKESPRGQTKLYDVEAYLCQFPETRIVLLLDEFDHLRTEAFTHDFLTELRAMTGVLEYDLACVTASYWDLYTLGTRLGLPPTSPFYNIFYPTPIYMSSLEPAEATSLIDTPAAKGGVRFTEDEVRKIQALAGSLPFFVQATAAKWFRHKRAGSVPDSEAARQQLAADLAPYFDQWWHNFSQNERTILLAVAGERPLTDLDVSPLELEGVVRRLHSYGLLRQADELCVNGRVFHTWLRQYAQLQATTPAIAKPISGAELARIRHALVDSFDLDELRTLCFDLGMDFESLPGESKPAKAREMVNYWRNRHNLTQLTQAIRTERGNII
ncbi:AAA family ATPase [Candidatus Leptofilum sp.]|uniref:nSTAND1 domain-containing NTPase n=1 Tax=Candidatus Leptofilum sp. TaxID=3241576 RepID=UPI003B5A5E6F